MNERCTSLLRATRLRNDLYCVEWDVRLHYTIHIIRENTEGRAHDFSLGAKTEVSKIEVERGFLGRGQQAPSPPARESGEAEHCELPQQGSGMSPDRSKVFHYFQHSWWPLMTL